MGRTYTTKEFIERAKQKHGNKFDYSQTDYFKAIVPVTIKCPIHGAYEILPRTHISSKYGCQKCGKQATATSNRWTTERFINEAIKKHGTKFDYKDAHYTNMNTCIIIHCPVHGEFKQTPANHLSGKGCAECWFASTRITRDEFIQKAKIKHGNLYDYSQVEIYNAHSMVTILCKKHGPFKQVAANHYLNGNGCRKCYDQSRKKKGQ
jgi:hypothetical protein